jgi:hypothetical protein
MDMTREQNLAVSYINGNISYVRNAIKKDPELRLPLYDELYDMLTEEDYKLFLKRMEV